LPLFVAVTGALGLVMLYTAPLNVTNQDKAESPQNNDTQLMTRDVGRCEPSLGSPPVNSTTVKATQIIDNGVGTYVEGQTFSINVTYTNSGSTAVNVTANLLFGSYTYLSQVSSAVTVPGMLSALAGSITQTFNVTVLAGATNAAVKINVNASYTILTQVFLVNQTASALAITVQGKAVLSVSSVAYTTSNGTYVGGMDLGVQVNYQNTGGTAVLHVTSTFYVGGYSYFSLVGLPAAVSVPASGTNYQDFTIAIAAAAKTNSSVLIDALATGTEQYTSRTLNSSNHMHVAIQAQASVSITSVAYTSGENGTYVGGMTFVVQVNYNNTGGTIATAIFTSLSFGSYTYLSANSSGYIRILPRSTAKQDFLVTVSTSAKTSEVSISASYTGTEKISDRALAGVSGSTLGANIQSRVNALTKSFGQKVADFFRDYGIFVFIGIGGIVVGVSVVGVRKSKVTKEKKLKEMSQGKRYFAKQAAGEIAGGNGAPIVGKLALIGKSAKDVVAAVAPEEFKPLYTAEQLAELKATEEEVTTFKEKKICLVHKGPVSGNIYLCPKCDALYCINCARALRAAGEKCWQCGAEVEVAYVEESTKPAPVQIPVTMPSQASAAPARQTKQSFVIANRDRIDKAMTALDFQHEAKMKFLKEMQAMAESDQIRSLMEIEKMAYPGNVTADEVSPTPEGIEEKLPQLTALQDDPGTVEDPAFKAFLDGEFTVLEQPILDSVNALKWPKEKKLVLLQELLALSPAERAAFIEDLNQQDDETE